MNSLGLSWALLSSSAAAFCHMAPSNGRMSIYLQSEAMITRAIMIYFRIISTRVKMITRWAAPVLFTYSRYITHFNTDVLRWVTSCIRRAACCCTALKESDDTFLYFGEWGAIFDNFDTARAHEDDMIYRRRLIGLSIGSIGFASMIIFIRSSPRLPISPDSAQFDRFREMSYGFKRHFSSRAGALIKSRCYSGHHKTFR